MLPPTNEYVSNLGLAQRGAEEAASQIAENEARRLIAALHVTPIAEPGIVLLEAATGGGPGPLTNFHPWPRMPLDLSRLVCLHTIPTCRIVRIFSDDIQISVMDYGTFECTFQTVLRAKARMWISPLAGVSNAISHLVRDPRHITGFRLRYINLHFNFDKDTLFFEDAAALKSLLGPVGDFEYRDRENEENIMAAFDKDGPQNVVLAGPVREYQDLYAVINHLAFVDTLIMEEPRRAKNTPHSTVAAREKVIRDVIEDGWKDVRGPTTNLPLLRFLPRHNIDFMASDTTTWFSPSRT